MTAYCGFSCNHCFLGEWCGGCRSVFSCCSYGTLYDKGKCPNIDCCEKKGLDGCDKVMHLKYNVNLNVDKKYFKKYPSVFSCYVVKQYIDNKNNIFYLKEEWIMALKSSMERASKMAGGFATAKKNVVIQYQGRERMEQGLFEQIRKDILCQGCLLYTSPSPRDRG